MTLERVATRRLRRDLKTNSVIAASTVLGAALVYAVTSLSTPSLVSAQIRPALSTTPQAQIRTTLQLTPQSEGTLDSYAEATKPGTTAATFQTWLLRANATATLSGVQTIVKLGLSFLGPVAPQVVGVAAGCFNHCPSNPVGSYKTKFGKTVSYECTGLEGCSYDKLLKRWRCSYRTCSFVKSATIIP